MTTIDKFDAGLRRLIDCAEIERVLVQYARGIDRCDRILLLECFHPDATEEHGTFSGSSAEFIDFTLPRVSSWFGATSHFLSNIWIDVVGDVAASEAYVLAIHQYADSPDELFLSGRYIDRFERRDGPWKIARRQLIVDQIYRHTPQKIALSAELQKFKRGGRGANDFARRHWSELLRVPSSEQ